MTSVTVRVRAATVRERSQGFTLLEMLVATMIMGIAVVGLLSNLSTSLRNAARLTEYDRAALLAKRKMDELLLDSRLPKDRVIEARFDPATTGVEGGWRARLATFEEPPKVAPGISVLERLELQVWWMSGEHKRVLSMEAFRTAMILPPNLAGGGGAP
jgi:prepilin-type N-terminal cleavage/methylation domain-containing protein